MYEALVCYTIIGIIWAICVWAEERDITKIASVLLFWPLILLVSGLAGLFSVCRKLVTGK